MSPSFLVRHRLLKKSIAIAFLFGLIWGVYRLMPYEPPSTTIDTGEKRPINYLVFSPDGKSLVTWARTRHSVFWDIATGEKLCAYPSINLRLSPSGKLIALMEQNGFSLWAAEDARKILSSIAGASFYGFSPDEKLMVFLSASPGATRTCSFEFWETGTWKYRGKITDVDSWRSLCFSADSRRVLLHPRHNTSPAIVSICEIADGSVNQVSQLRLPQCESIYVSPDFRLAVVNEFSEVFEEKNTLGEPSLWDLEQKQKIFSFDCKSAEYVAFSGDSKRLILHAVRYTRDDWHESEVWDLSAPPRLIGTVHTRSHVVPSPDGNFLAVVEETGAHVVDFSTLKVRANCVRASDIPENDSRHGEPVPPTISFSPDSRLLLATDLREQPSPAPFFSQWLPDAFNPFRPGGGEIGHLWEVETGRELLTLRGCRRAAFSPDGMKLASIDVDGIISVWNLPLQKPLGKIFVIAGLLWACAVLAPRVARRTRRSGAADTSQPSPRAGEAKDIRHGEIHS